MYPFLHREYSLFSQNSESELWFAEDDNTGFLSVGVDIFDRLYLKEQPISLPVVPMSTIKQIYDK